MKTLASLLLTLSILFAMSPSTLAFDDIRSPILEEAVNYLSAEGIIKGYPDGTFKPEQTINRAEALKIIFESLGEDPVTLSLTKESGSDGMLTTNPFPDVDASLWFAQYVQAAKDRGLIKGYPDGTYKPTQSVNRVEFVKIAMLAQSHYESIQNSIASDQYSDLDANEWYMPYIAFGVYRNFLNESDRFQPTEAMSRGDAALIIYRIAQYNQSGASQESASDGPIDPKNPQAEDYTRLNEYEVLPISQDKLEIIERPDGTSLIKHYEAGYEFEVPANMQAGSWSVEDSTVKIYNDECYIRFTLSTDTIDPTAPDDPDDVALDSPYGVDISYYQWDGLGGLVKEYYAIFGNRYISIYGTGEGWTGSEKNVYRKESADCIDPDFLLERLKPLQE